MSINEEKVLEELRKRMKGDMEPDMYEDINLFYRFLKARNFNLKNAEGMLRNHLEWLKKLELKNKMVPEVIKNYYPYNFIGYDKEGCVVRYVPMGTFDINGFVNSIKPDEMEICVKYWTDDDAAKLKEQSKKLKKTVDKYICICNLEHLSLRSITNKRVMQLNAISSNCFEKNFPERLKATYIINGPSFITILYNLSKMVVAPEILRKFHFYSDDSWKKDLLKEIDADVLPAFLGGTRTDPDGNPLCLTFINHGEKIPEKYYIHRSKRSLSDLDGVKKISLSTGSLHEEFYYIEESGSCIEWEFETKCRDIGFGLFYVDVSDGEERMNELVPLQRTNTKDYSESGKYICEKAGKYVFMFDNSYSWLRTKEVYYRIKIITPEEEKSQTIPQ